MFPFFGYGQATVPAHLVHHLFHGCQVFGCGVQLMAVFIADRVSHQVKVEMATVLMDSHQDLMARENFICEFLAENQHFFRRNLFIFMKR